VQHNRVRAFRRRLGAALAEYERRDAPDSTRKREDSGIARNKSAPLRRRADRAQRVGIPIA